MRHLSREKAQAQRLLDRARTIAVVRAAAKQRSRATAAYLRRTGYDGCRSGKKPIDEKKMIVGRPGRRGRRRTSKRQRVA